jgi:EAL domain-containing protein (putative c-di-GMP-specific phosphodiesterase class I)
VHSIDNCDLYVTASIGICLYPDGGSDAETLIKNADTAMYQAKKNGRHDYKFYSKDMDIPVEELESLEQSLRHALDRNELTLHYQPKIDLKTGAIAGTEALTRWMHPTRGTVLPGQFIPIAEKSGMMLPIGAWGLGQACMQARTWADAGMPAKTMIVNVSGEQFQRGDFLEALFAVLNSNGLDPGSLELDLTETVLLNHPERTAFILKSLRDKGVMVSVDNFGTGRSNLSSIQKLPLSALKIDRSFVRQITTVPGGASTVGALIDLGRSLNLRVIAQGVETPEDLEFLWAHNCDEAQGNYFSRPVPPDQLTRLLQSR